MKNEYIQIRISEQEKGELGQMSSELDKPVSQIVREAIRDRLEQWKSTQANNAESATSAAPA